MTVRLLADWTDPVTTKRYKVNHLLTRDAATETGLVAAKLADTNLSGGVAWSNTDTTRGIRTVQSEEDPLTGKKEIKAEGNVFSKPMIIAKSSCTLLGDSLNQYGVDVSGSIVGTCSNHPLCWANDLLAMYGMQLDVLYQRAVAGSTLTDLETTSDAAVTDPTEIAWVHSGINSLSTSGEIDTKLAERVYRIMGKLSAAKQLVVWDSIDPVGALIARSVQILAYNAMIKSIAGRFENVVYNDTCSALLDPASDLLFAKSGYIQSSDNIHKATTGAMYSGYQTAQAIMEKAVIVPYKTAANFLPPFWVSGQTAGTMTPGSGTISGAVVPTGWNVAVTSGNAAVTMSTVGAEIVRAAIANTGGADSIVEVSYIDTAGLAAMFASGDIIRGSWMAQARDLVGLKQASTQVIIDGSKTLQGGGISGFEASPIYPTKSWAGRRSTLPFALTSNPSAIAFKFTIKVGPTNGAAKIDLANPRLEKLT